MATPLSERQRRIIMEPYSYIQNLPGKNVRGRMLDAFQLWLRSPQDKADEIKMIIDNLHNASLLIDDIEDDSDLRRGKPVAHHVYGVSTTINCANYVYFLALQKCQKLGSFNAMQVFTDEMLKLHEGQGLDIYWRDHFKCPSEESYIDMVENKTGGLFRLAVGLLQTFSENKSDFIPLLNSLSVYFQIRDDYINLLDEEFMEHKSYCEDLTEGKFSFPLIVGIQSDGEDTRLENILRQRTKDVELKKYAVQVLHDVGAFQRTRAKLEEIITDIRRQIQALGGNEPLTQIVEFLHTTVEKLDKK